MKRFDFANLNEALVFKFLLVTWIITKLISFKLWFQLERLFPRIPAFQLLTFNGFEIVDLALAVIGFSLLLFLVFKPKPKLIITLISIEFLLCIFDILRFQPFQFQLMLLSSIYAWKPKRFDFNLILLLSATYFFAGLSKLNLGFINVHWAYYFLEQGAGFPREIAQIPFVKAVGFGIPFIESLAGLLLLSKYQNIACKALILFHIATLLFIGPFFLNVNQAVWPWNISMILLLWHILNQKKFELTFSFFAPFIQKLYVSILFVFPFLGFTNYYHPYAAFHLYKGKETYLMLQSTSPLLAEFHQDNPRQLAQKNAYYTTFATTISLAEFHVPVASVPWLHLRIIEVLQTDKNFSKTEFYYFSYPYQKVSEL